MKKELIRRGSWGRELEFALPALLPAGGPERDGYPFYKTRRKSSVSLSVHLQSQRRRDSDSIGISTMGEATLSVENLCKAFDSLCKDFFSPSNKAKVRRRHSLSTKNCFAINTFFFFFESMRTTSAWRT